MKGVTVRGSIRNPKELASLVGRCNVFLYLSLPFCRQLIKNKQLGDIEVAIRSIKGNVDKAKDFVQRRKAMKERLKRLEMEKRQLLEASNKPGSPNPRYRKSKGDTKGPGAGRIRKTGLMGGGKVYASMDKKYGGGIFPRKGNI